jgi:hypothetical protein
VIIDGHHKVRPGMTVEVMPLAAPAAEAPAATDGEAADAAPPAADAGGPDSAAATAGPARPDAG